ncbi:MAG: class I SAM-dependent methyltransferase [Candidatus Methylomirabilia bacterium]
MPSPDNPELSRRFLTLLEGEPLRDRLALDVGCGAGRLTFELATRCRRVIGVDRDPMAIRTGRRRAVALGISNIEFLLADAESMEYAVWSPDLVAAYLCMSDAILERASRALDPGRLIAFACFHMDQWRETGTVSRFAYDEDRLRAALTVNGFAVECLEVERQVFEFASADEAVTRLAGLRAKWERDGRWQRYLAFLERGGRTLTRSHLIVRARRH